MKNKMIALMFFSSIALAFSNAASAAFIDNWTFTGSGTTSLTQPDPANVGKILAEYNNDGVTGSGSWSFLYTAQEARDYSFDLSYYSFHSWFQASRAVYSVVNGVQTLLWSQASGGGVTWSDTVAFNNVALGDSIGFNITGYHNDSSRLMHGSVELTETASVADVPAPLALSGLALMVLGGLRRRRTV